MAQVRAHQPALAEAAVNDPPRFARLVRDMLQQYQGRGGNVDRERERQEFGDFSDDPFDVETQRRIEEQIRQEAVMENLNNAMEHHPESFGTVTMLYVDVEVNGHKVKAFVDSGAQATIMSPACAERCGIMRLVDTRFAGVAHGVGTAKILGRVHSAQVKVGSLFLLCSFTIMEGGTAQNGGPLGPDMLLGLDNLRRHQACIDLKDNKLRIGDEAVSFLSEHEAPKQAAGPGADLPAVEGEGGARMSQSGAVLRPPAVEGAGGAFSGTGNVLGGRSSAPSSSSAAPRAPPQQSPTGTTADGGRKYGDAQIEQLQAMGFDRAECVQALEATDGDVELAAGLLL